MIENIVYESRPGLVVTANLYLPENPSGTIPAVVVVHSHHAPKVQSELQDLGMTWARSGTAVLVMDQLCAGERVQSQPWPRESYYGRYALGSQLYLAGESLIKWMAWDLMRGIDLLLERPYIDPGRIIMLGAVAGGGDPAAVTAVLDPRVAAVIPFNFGEAGPEEHYTEGPPVRQLWTRVKAGVEVEALAIETEPGMTLPFLLLKPAGPGAARAPAVPAIAEGGKERFLSERDEDLMILIRNRVAVCLPDLRNTGEISASKSRAPAAMDLAANELMLGRTLLDDRLKDARTLLTALYEDGAAAVAGRGGLVSFLSVREDRFSHVPQDVIVPGILEAADVSDIAGALGPRPVLLERCVDGRNLTVRNERLRAEFGAAAKASPGLVVRDVPAEPGLASWLSVTLRRGAEPGP